MRDKYVVCAILVLLAVALFSGWKVVSILAEYREGESTYEAITEEYAQRTEDTAGPTDKSSASVSTDSTNAPHEGAPITVDFDVLLEENSDVVGWIYCENRPINSPIVQSNPELKKAENNE